MPYKLISEAFAGLEWASTAAAWPLLNRLPEGDGHPVLVLPGLLTNDLATWPLREFLESRRYAVYPWDQGLNRGPVPETMSNLEKKIDEIHAAHGRKVSLVGWSMGGAIAVALTKKKTKKVRQVITLGSPHEAGVADEQADGWIKSIFETLSGLPSNSKEVRGLLDAHPSIPLTTIFSKRDGVVPWRASIDQDHPLTQAIEIDFGLASHMGIVAHPGSFYLISEVLRQPHDDWRPYEPKEAWERLLFDTHRSPAYKASPSPKKRKPTS